MNYLDNRKILLCIDGSEYSFNAARYVGRFLNGRGIQIVLFHTMNRINEIVFDMGVQPTARENITKYEDWEIEQEKHTAAFMEKAYSILIDENYPEELISIKIQKRKVGIARDIISEAQEGYCAVVVGRKGMSKLKDLILGSIAIKLIEGISHIPVWVVGGMPDTAKVIIGLDASEGARKAVAYTGSILSGMDVDILLLKVVRWADIVQAEDIAKNISPMQNAVTGGKEAGIFDFEEARRLLVEAGVYPDSITAKCVTEADSRAGTIMEIAENDNYGTIILGRRGISKVKEFLMGRVSNKVIHLAKEKAVWVVN